MCLRLLLCCDDDLVLSQAIASNIFIKVDQLFRAINSCDFPALEANQIRLLKTRLHLKTRVSHAQHNFDQVQLINVEFSSGTPPLPTSAGLCTVQNQSSAHLDC